jgi:hypothetical protein
MPPDARRPATPYANTDNTFGKLISDVPWAASGIGGNNGSGSFQDWYNLHAERSLSAQDIAHSLTVSYDYQIPIGKGKLLGSNWRGPPQWFLGNWELNGIVKANTDTPLALTASVNDTSSFGGGSRPNTNGHSAAQPGSRPKAKQIQEWFDISTFSPPVSFTFGNVARTLSDVRAPGVIISMPRCSKISGFGRASDNWCSS